MTVQRGKRFVVHSENVTNALEDDVALVLTDPGRPDLVRAWRLTLWLWESACMAATGATASRAARPRAPTTCPRPLAGCDAADTGARRDGPMLRNTDGQACGAERMAAILLWTISKLNPASLN